MKTTKHEAPVAWQELLKQAVNVPGRAAECYRAFHNYSFGNQLLVAWQCMARGIELGPIATFKKWKSLGRFVQKGQRALILCVPVMKTIEEEGEKKQILCGFTYQKKWFTVSQTDGDDVEFEDVPGFDPEKAMAELKIEKVPFTMVNGNCQGYATKGRKLAINPVAQHPLRTLLHEMAHITLGHTSDGDVTDGEKLEYNLCELEAEAVAYLLCDTFGLPGAEESRDYIQHWYKSNEVPEKQAHRIFNAASKILEAGKVEATTTVAS